VIPVPCYRAAGGGTEVEDIRWTARCVGVGE
jgi:hypothetical protein